MSPRNRETFKKFKDLVDTATLKLKKSEHELGSLRKQNLVLK